MKKALIFILSLTILISCFTVIASADTKTSAEYALDDTYTESSPMDVGTYELKLRDDKQYTLFVFKPAEIGIYTMTVDSDAVIGWWGAYPYGYLRNPGSTASSIEREIKSVGNMAVIGISAPDGQVSLTIEKTGDSEGLIEIVYEEYVNEHTPVAGDYLADEISRRVDVTTPHEAVLGDDGLYHLDTADGPVLYVDLYDDSVFNLSLAYGSYGALSFKGTYDGKPYNFKPAMKKYNEVLSGTTGIYPLTIDIIKFVKGYGTNQGWFDPALSPLVAIQSGEADPDTAWMAVCIESRGSGSADNPIRIWDTNIATLDTVDYRTGYHEDTAPKYYHLGEYAGDLTVVGSSDFALKLGGKEYTSKNGRLTVENAAASSVIEITGIGAYQLTFEIHNECTLSHIEEKQPTHTDDGNIEYWRCDICGVCYSRNDSTSEKLDESGVIIPAKGHAGAEYHPEIPADCTEGGSTEYYYCEECGCKLDGTESDANVLADSSITIPAKGHTDAVYHPETTASCTQNGQKAYYYCNICKGKYDGTAANSAPLDDAELTIPANGHMSAVFVAEIPADCTVPGTAAHYYCPICDASYSSTDIDARDLTESELVLPPLGHPEIVKVTEVQASHTDDGHIEYWHCPLCKKSYDGQDSDSRELTDDEIIIKSQGHIGALKIDGMPAKCTLNGTFEHYYCEICDARYFTTDANSEKISENDLIIPATGHTGAAIVHFSDATCTADGNIEYYHCGICGGNYTDASENGVLLSDEDIVIPAKGHTGAVIVHLSDATCTADGNIEYYHCEICGKDYLTTDADSEPIEDGEKLLPALFHVNAVKVDAAAPTCTEDGNIEYYSCPDCGCALDSIGESAKILTQEEISIPSHHTFDEKFAFDENHHWHKCSACGLDGEKLSHTYGTDGVCTECMRERESSGEAVSIFGLMFKLVADLFKLIIDFLMGIFVNV